MDAVGENAVQHRGRGAKPQYTRTQSTHVLPHRAGAVPLPEHHGARGVLAPTPCAAPAAGWPWPAV